MHEVQELSIVHILVKRYNKCRTMQLLSNSDWSLREIKLYNSNRNRSLIGQSALRKIRTPEAIRGKLI